MLFLVVIIVFAASMTYMNACTIGFGGASKSFSANKVGGFGSKFDNSMIKSSGQCNTVNNTKSYGESKIRDSKVNVNNSTCISKETDVKAVVANKSEVRNKCSVSNKMEVDSKVKSEYNFEFSKAFSYFSNFGVLILVVLKDVEKILQKVKLRKEEGKSENSNAEEPDKDRRLI